MLCDWLPLCLELYINDLKIYVFGKAIVHD